MEQQLTQSQTKERIWDILNTISINEETKARLDNLVNHLQQENELISLNETQTISRILDIMESVDANENAIKKVKVFCWHLVNSQPENK